MSHPVTLSRLLIREPTRTIKEDDMTPRLNPFAAAPKEMKAWLDYSLTVGGSLEKPLLELVKIRASQINGCANCLNMHTYEARQAGETERGLHLLAAWREAPCYSERELRALAWTEHLTLIAGKGHDEGVRTALDA